MNQKLSLKSQFHLPLNTCQDFKKSSNDLVLNFIGSANYASRILIPEFKNQDGLRYLAANGGVTPTGKVKNMALDTSTDMTKVVEIKMQMQL